MAPRRMRGAGNLKRQPAKRQPKKRIIAYCEGRNTEPGYILEFSRLVCNPLVDVEATGPHGAPVTIVEHAVQKKRDLERIARKSKDPLDKLFEVWAVFDCDDHPNLDRAFDTAKSNGVLVAYSNPCFEIWPLLHIREQTAFIDRHSLQRELERELEGYHSGSSKCVNARRIHSDYECAKTRAVRLADSHEQVDSPMANPYTDIYLMLDKIKDNGSS